MQDWVRTTSWPAFLAFACLTLTPARATAQPETRTSTAVDPARFRPEAVQLRGGVPGVGWPVDQARQILWVFETERPALLRIAKRTESLDKKHDALVADLRAIIVESRENTKDAQGAVEDMRAANKILKDQLADERSARWVKDTVMWVLVGVLAAGGAAAAIVALSRDNGPLVVTTGMQ